MTSFPVAGFAVVNLGMEVSTDTDVIAPVAITFDADTMIALVLVAVTVAAVAGVWVRTLIRVRASRRLGIEGLTGRLQHAAALNRTAVLVTLAGLAVVTIVLAWRLAVAII